MLEKGKISPRQAGELLFMTILATVILFIPAITAQKAGHDAWLATFAGSLFGLVPLSLVIWLGHRHPQQTIYQYSETILGRYLGKLAGVAYIWLFLHISTLVVRQFAEFLTTAFMPRTPLSVFILSILFIAALAARSGLEAIARMNEFIILLVVGSLLTVITFSLPEWQPANNLLPFLARGIMPVLEGALVPASWHGEIITLAVILPYLTRPKSGLVSGGAAIIASAMLITLGVIGALSLFGPQLTAAFRFPLHFFVRTIDIAEILTRFEVVVMVTWVAGVFIKTSVILYCTALGVGQVFGLSEYRSTVLPLGIIMAVLSVTQFDNVVELVAFLSDTWPLYSISIFYLGLPSLLLAASFFRGKMTAPKAEERKTS